MELNKNQWTQEDGQDLINYLRSLSNPSKIEWSKKILNTNLEVFAISTKIIYNIVNEIAKGNFLSFLDLKLFDNYNTIVIYGSLLLKISDFDIMEKYLKEYFNIMENWAHCDILNFEINHTNIQNFLNLSATLINDNRVFVRRFSLFILLLICKDEQYLAVIFNTLEKLNNEDQYYVIMMAGWLLSECIIRHTQTTLKYLDTATFNPKIINKAVQKCRESLRLTKEFKDELLKYKKKS